MEEEKEEKEKEKEEERKRGGEWEEEVKNTCVLQSTATSYRFLFGLSIYLSIFLPTYLVT